MSPRAMAAWLLRRGATRSWQPSIRVHASVNCRRSIFGSTKPQGPTCFTVGVPSPKKAMDPGGLQSLIADIQQKTELSNPQDHDSAVVLVTPGLAKLLSMDGIPGYLASFLAGPASSGNFHILTAVVDHVAPPLGSGESEEGISILRGRRDDILPQLWQPSTLEAEQDPDAVGALTFGLGDICTVTVPLARTIFQNNKMSTLTVSSFEMSEDGPARLVESMESFTRHISLPASALERSQSELQFSCWLPMLPLTHARTVTESYGNIVRGVDVGGKTVPASSELEEAVNGMYSKHKLSTDAPTAPINVFALVMPKLPAVSPENPRPAPDSWLDVSLEENELSQLVSRNSQYLEEAYLNGGHLYKLLSGGGGWGVKKGLLSLDPQRSHFALSDEEEMQRFFQQDGESNFAPPGSEIQFFASVPSPPRPNIDEGTQGFVFGVFDGNSAALPVAEEEEKLQLRTHHFGALSDHAMYMSSKRREDSKIAVPGSRISLSRNLDEASSSRNFAADVGTFAVLGALFEL